MLAKVYSCAVVGLEGLPVEVDISQRLPSFLIVGLPDAAVQESKERVRGGEELGCLFSNLKTKTARKLSHSAL